MEKKVQIDLASKKSTASANYAEIKEAIENASLGLFSKYSVQIVDVLAINGTIVMSMRIPDDIVETFNIGNHMRGVSAYLLKKYNDKFSNLVVGKRLLNYTVIASPPEQENPISFLNKLSAISKFVELLKHDDAESEAKIYKIIAILNEED